jgi:hypothetical protein
VKTKPAEISTARENYLEFVRQPVIYGDRHDRIVASQKARLGALPLDQVGA